MRLLLVEDEEKLARLVKRALTSERFSVDMALAGREGMDLANTYDYDLLILEHRDVGRTCLVSRAKPTSMAGRWERCEGLLVGADGSCGQRISRPPTRRLGHALFPAATPRSSWRTEGASTASHPLPAKSAFNTPYLQSALDAVYLSNPRNFSWSSWTFRSITRDLDHRAMYAKASVLAAPAIIDLKICLIASSFSSSSWSCTCNSVRHVSHVRSQIGRLRTGVLKRDFWVLSQDYIRPRRAWPAVMGINVHPDNRRQHSAFWVHLNFGMRAITEEKYVTKRKG